MKDSFYETKEKPIQDNLKVMINNNCDVETIYEELNSSEVEYYKESIYESYHETNFKDFNYQEKTNRSNEINEWKNNLKKLDNDPEECFEIISSLSKDLFRQFRHFVNTIHDNLKKGESDKYVKNLENFIAKQNNPSRNSLRFYLTNLQVVLKLQKNNYCLHLQNLFLHEFQNLPGTTLEIPAEDFLPTQTIIHCGFLSLRNSSVDSPLLTTQKTHSFLNLIIEKPKINNVLFCLYVCPLNMYIHNIQKAFPEIYEFFLFLNKDSKTKTKSKSPQIEDSPQPSESKFSFQFLKKQFGLLKSEDEEMEENINSILRQSLSSIQKVNQKNNLEGFNFHL